MILPRATERRSRRQAGWPTAAAVLLAALGTGLPLLGAASNASPSPVPNAFVLRRPEFIPQFRNPPRMQPVGFPREQPAATVEELLQFENRLWIVARARTGSPSPASRRLWTFSLEHNRLQPVKGVLEQYAPEALWGHGREVWMAVRGGAAALHTGDFAVEGFNAGQGLSATNLVGIAEAEGQLLVFSENGLVFGLDNSGANFTRLGSPAPASNPRAPDPWRRFATSSSYILALGSRTAAVRHAQGTEWIPFSEVLIAGTARTGGLRLVAAEGDGGGGFWAGSDAGLHWLNPSNGAADNWFWPIGVTVNSGLPATFTPATRPSNASVNVARDRIASGIRDRMRDRARLARISVETKHPVDPVTSTSRLPGGVQALHRDGQWLWVATADGVYSGNSRIVLFHQPTRKWVGWFPVSMPVRALCTTDRLLYLGLDASSSPTGNPLLVLDKLPLTSVPSSKWMPDELSDRELGEHLASLPVAERAVHAFFARDAATVVRLLSPIAETASAEELFLLAFAHDPLGLDQPREFDRYAGLLLERWPDTPFGEIVHGLQAQRGAAAVAAPSPVNVTPPEAPTETVSLADIFKRWDRNNDGAIDDAEFQAWQGTGAKLKPFDADGDGQLGPSEVLGVLKVSGGQGAGR